MPPLKNIRHEAFAQRLVEATKTKRTNGEAYSLAGYQATGNAAEAAASRLLSDSKTGVAKRVQEIMERGAKAASVTTQSLLAELDRVMDGAMSAEQYGAARAAIDSKARLKGLFVDKLEVGRPGDFDACKTPTEVADAFLDGRSIGEALDALDAMRELLMARAGHEAILIPPSPAPASRANGHAIETAAAIKAMTPRRRR
jgi:hypothetical protein